MRAVFALYIVRKDVNSSADCKFMGGSGCSIMRFVMPNSRTATYRNSMTIYKLFIKPYSKAVLF